MSTQMEPGASTGSAKSIRVSIPIISDGRESTPLETVREDANAVLSTNRSTERTTTASPSDVSFTKSVTDAVSHASLTLRHRSGRYTELKKEVPFNSAADLTVRTANDLRRVTATQIIERIWISYRDKQMFKLLKHSLCAAETSLSREILRKICPREADLLTDKGMPVKVRFRFGGTEFPPMIYFKIFSDGSTAKVHYISGRHAIQPATQAAADARDRMGNRKFFEIMLQDAAQRGHLKITDAIDVTTMKDYMRYLSNMDETPAHLGGKDNTWRKLLLDAVPRASMFYDVIDYVYSSALSDRLRQNLPLLLLPPSTPDVRQRQAEVVAALSAAASSVPLVARVRSLASAERRGPGRAAAQRTSAPSESSSRRRKQLRRVAQLRRAYGLDARQVAAPTAETAETGVEWEDGGDDGASEDDEAEKLFQWSQELSLDDLDRSFALDSPSSASVVAAAAAAAAAAAV